MSTEFSQPNVPLVGLIIQTYLRRNNGPASANFFNRTFLINSLMHQWAWCCVIDVMTM